MFHLVFWIFFFFLISWVSRSISVRSCVDVYVEHKLAFKMFKSFDFFHWYTYICCYVCLSVKLCGRVCVHVCTCASVFCWNAFIRISICICVWCNVFHVISTTKIRFIFKCKNLFIGNVSTKYTHSNPPNRIQSPFSRQCHLCRCRCRRDLHAIQCNWCSLATYNTYTTCVYSERSFSLFLKVDRRKKISCFSIIMS